MKKVFLSILFMFLLVGLAYADNNGHGGGHGWGWGRGGFHGVPDPGTTLSLLGIGVAAAGVYSVFRKGKRK